MTVNLTAPIDFLTEHFRETAGGVEISAMKRGSPVVSRLIARDGTDWPEEQLAAVLLEMMKLNRNGYAVYYGVATTRKARGKKRSVIGLPCYWADVDFKTVCPDKPPHIQDEYVYELLMHYLPEQPPNAIVHSGGGMQALWTFWRPIPLDMYHHPPERLEAVNRGIQKRVHSDAVHNADRLLRLPGFVNHKYDHQPVATVVKPYGDEPYTYLDFEKWRLEEPAPVHRVSLPDDQRLDVPPWIQDYLDAPPPEGQRNATLFRIAATLKDYGWPQDDAEYMLAGFAGLPERETLKTIASAFRKAPRGVRPTRAITNRMLGDWYKKD